MILSGDYIVAAEENDSNYAAVLDKIRSAPKAPDGYQYRLRADTLEWQLVELPEPEPEDEDATAEEILNIMLGGDGE